MAHTSQFPVLLCWSHGELFDKQFPPEEGRSQAVATTNVIKANNAIMAHNVIKSQRHNVIRALRMM